MKTKLKDAHIYRRIISLILTVVLLFLAIPQTIFAEIQSAVEENDTQAPASGAANSVKDSYSYNVSGDVYELEERREASVKHFRTEDGSIVAAQYPTDVHIIDGNGKWQDIDNTLSDLGGEYGTGNTGIKFAKKITGNDSLFTIHDGNGKLTMSLDGAIKKTAGKIVSSTAEDGDGTKLGKLMNLENLSSRIIYENIQNGVDLEYIVNGRNVKENIIVKEHLDSYSFTFTLKLNNLEASLLSDGSVRIFDGDGETVFSIPTPVTYDAEGNYAPAEATYFTLEQTGDNTYSLTVTTDSEWMNAPERAFPVTVDPTLSVITANVADTSVRSNHPLFQQNYDSQLYVINSTSTSYAYWKVTELPSIPDSAKIIDATITLHCTFVSNDSRVAVYNVTSSWPNNVTWATYTASGYGATASTVSDYVFIPANGQNKKYTWDITDIVSGWYSGAANNGICFKNISSPGSETRFGASDNLTAAYRPVFTVTYRDIKGLEPYYSYLSQDLGLAGTGYVNIATGQTTITNGTLTTTDSLFGFTPTLVYNSSLAGKSYSYENAQVPYSASETKTPYGFKWNFQESIVKKEYVDSNGATKDYYVLADADGTEHAFFDSGVADENEAKIYHDEDSLQLKMYINTSEIVIKDLNKTERHYTKTTFSGYGASAWYLTSIVDANGNKLDFTWKSGTYLPTSVKVTPKGSSTVTMLQFLYTSDNVPYAIYNPASKDAVVFRYSESPQGSLSTAAWQYLRSMTWVKATSSANITSYYNSSSTTGITVLGSASYTYNDPYGTIFSAVDELAGRRVNYELNVPSMATSSIVEYSSDLTKGQTINLEYYTSAGYTKITNSGNDDIINTIDDVISYCNFDKSGKIIGNYSTDRGGYKLYGAAFGEYSTQENSRNNIKQSFSLDGSNVNLLVNGSFSDNDGVVPNYWTVDNAVIAENIIDSLMIFDLTDSNSASVSQSLTLPVGTYTLSAHLEKDPTYNDSDLFYTDGVTVKFKVKWDSDTATEDGKYVFEKVVNGDDCNTFNKSNILSGFTFTTTEAGRYTVSIIVTRTSSDTGNIVSVDDVMLEESIGIGERTEIELGGFDTKNENVNIDSFWDNDSSDFETLTISEPFGEVAAIASDIKNRKYVKQTVVENSTYIVDNKNKSYLISGFAKAPDALVNDTAFFGIRVEIYYYESDGSISNNIDAFILPFSKNNEDWQFAAGIIETGKDRVIYKVEVFCEYSYQPYGTAYFDNIALTNKLYTSKIYEYYDNGLLYYEREINTQTVYEYNADGKLTRSADIGGNLVDYVYGDDGVTLEKEIYYTYKNLQIDQAYPINENDEDDFDADSQITKVPRHIVEYEYNNFGLSTAVSTYPVQYSGSEVVRIPNSEAITSSYEYVTTSGSRIFGALLTETDYAGRELRYYHDTSNGCLLASINVTDGNGTAYTYDDFGNLVTVMPATYISDYAYTTDINAENVTYTYDEHNRLSTVVTDSTTYTFAYDVFGNSSFIGVGTNELTSYEYNSYNGKLKKLNYANGTSVEYKYNDLDNVSEIWYTENEGTPTLAYSYTYTAKGQLYSIEDHINETRTVYAYDSRGRLTEICEQALNGETKTFEYKEEYDKNDSLLDYEFRFYYDTPAGTQSASPFYWYNRNSQNQLYQEDISFPNSTIEIEYSYDDLERVTSKVYSCGNYTDTTAYKYKSYSGNAGLEIEKFSTRINNGTALEYTYTYDANGNITRISGSDGSEYRYVYDDLGQLVREDNTKTGQTYLYEYDNAGNITLKKTHTLTAEGVTPTSGYSVYLYQYTDSSWGDKLTKYRGVSITYDEIGNPLFYYNGTSYDFEWVQGRRLDSVTTGGKEYNYTYNADGIRTSKSDGTLTKEYLLLGTRILAEQWSNGVTIIYAYDSTSSPVGMLYRTANYAANVFDTYLFQKNLQGDVIAVYNKSGTKLVGYVYDAWGNVTTTYYNGGTSTGAQYNPFTYRGYYRDSETGFYYLNTRYYDPVFGRFINADSYISTDQGFTACNMFAYCGNNPVSRVDYGGNFWDTIFDVISLGFSVVEVCVNPSDPWAWAGLAGDVVDLIPFVTGVGETTKAIKTTVKVVDKIDDVTDVAKAIDNTTDIVQIAKAVDFTEDAADIVKSLDRSSGFTRSTASLGRQIHQGYKVGANFNPRFKENRLLKGHRPDYIDFDNNIIYELKPMNPRGVRSGIRQLQRYNKAYGGGFTLRLELY